MIRVSSAIKLAFGLSTDLPEVANVRDAIARGTAIGAAIHSNESFWQCFDTANPDFNRADADITPSRPGLPEVTLHKKMGIRDLIGHPDLVLSESFFKQDPQTIVVEIKTTSTLCEFTREYWTPTGHRVSNAVLAHLQAYTYQQMVQADEYQVYVYCVADGLWRGVPRLEYMADAFAAYSAWLNGENNIRIENEETLHLARCVADLSAAAKEKDELLEGLKKDLARRLTAPLTLENGTRITPVTRADYSEIELLLPVSAAVAEAKASLELAKAEEKKAIDEVKADAKLKNNIKRYVSHLTIKHGNDPD